MAAAPPSFVSKPTRGWLHPDHLFARDGINYAVRYQKIYAGRYPQHTLQTIISCQLMIDQIIFIGGKRMLRMETVQLTMSKKHKHH